MDTREEIKDLLSSLMQFQKECPVLHKDKKAHNKNYVTLTTIDATVKPLLREKGLIYTQFLDGVSVNTTIWHVETGQRLSYSFEIPKVNTPNGMNGYQNIGSGITYIRRYALCSALGIMSDEDKDATGLTQGLNDYKDILLSCESIEELESMYTSLSSKVKRNNSVVKAFSERKKQLQNEK